MSAYVGVTCDGCGETRGRRTVVQPAAGPIRAELKAEGWHRTRGTVESVSGRPFGYTRDICPGCWKGGKR